MQAPEKKLRADDGYGIFPRCREALRKGGIAPRVVRCAIETSERLGRYRCG